MRKKIMRMMRSTNSSVPSAGFTLIEILIVLGIIAILGTTIGFSLFGVRQGQDLDGTAKRIAGVLQEAQQRSITQEGGLQYGVRFKKSSTASHTFELFQTAVLGFQGGYYNPQGGEPGVTSIKPYTLKSSIEFVEPTGATPGNDWVEDIAFEKISGVPAPGRDPTANPPVYSEIRVKIVGSVCPSSDCKIIKTNDQGTIEIQ